MTLEPTLTYYHSECPTERTRPIAFLILATAALLAGCAGQDDAADTASITTSANDDRHYRHVVLDNELSVVLISDPATDKAAASLSVYRGSYDNPESRPGLAHFLEHMLFLGTAKYPEVDGYQSFIATHGGGHNAYTGSDHTNYFFDIDPAFFDGALDRFAQFFIAPNFDADYVEREKNAVNSEYQLQIKDDGWRGFMVGKTTLNPNHPGSRFNIGSLESLSGDVRSDLLSWFKANYSANQMGLVVLGNQSLDQLETWVRQMFSPIENRQLGPGAKPGPLFSEGYLPRQLAFQTINDERSIKFSFPTPSVDEFYRDDPIGYISNLLGHEGAGSLHAALKDRGWIHSLAGGGGRYDRDNGVISVSIELTDLGAAHTDSIAAALFSYIELIGDSVEAWRYDEQARLSSLAFRFQDKAKPSSYVRSISPDLANYPVADVLVAPYLMERFDADLIQRFLSYLTPDNVEIEIAGPDIDTDQIEPWFEVPYRISPASPIGEVPDDVALALPPANPFIPENVDLVAASQSKPELLKEGPGEAIWLAPDTSFGVPRTVLNLRLAVPGGFVSAADSAYASLYARLVQDSLTELSYPAVVAGLGYSIGADNAGFVITLRGYSDKLPLLLDHVLQTFSELEPTAERVELYRSHLHKDWLNFTNERPYTQAYSSLGHLLIDGRWAPTQLADAIADADVGRLNRWRKERLDQFNALGLVVGNATPAEVAHLSNQLKSTLTLKDFEVTEPAVVTLDPGQLVHSLAVDHDDAAMVLYLQGRTDEFDERALYGLSGQLLRAPYFTDLRTEQQLGYVVSASNVLLRRTPGMSFAVQSPVVGADQLVAATEAFLESFRDTLANMPTEQFEANKQGLITRLLEQDKNLAERDARYWSDLTLGFTSFDTRQRLAEAVAAIDKASYLTFFDGLRHAATDNRLVIYSPGRFEKRPDGTQFGPVPKSTPTADEGTPVALAL